MAVILIEIISIKKGTNIQSYVDINDMQLFNNSLPFRVIEYKPFLIGL